MKIAFLHFGCGLIDRGSEISTRTLASYFAKKKHKVVLYQMGKEKKESYEVKQIKFAFQPQFKKNTHFFGKILARFYLDYDSLISLVFSLRASFSLVKLKPDVIVPTNGFWQILVCKLAKVLTKSKIVVIGRAGIGWTDRDNLRLSPDLFIGLTKKAQAWAKTVNFQVKSIYLPNPINLSSFLKKSKTISLNLEKPIILTVAALTPYKNIDQLILACSKLKKVSLLVVGQGELLSSLNKLGEKHLKNRFLIKSFKHDQMSSVYEGSDLFALLSGQQEAFGRVFLEAMAFALPVVTTDIPARREIVGLTGTYIKDLKQKTIIEALKKGLKIKKSAKYQQQAKKFDVNIIGLQYEKVFLKLLEK